jgi:RNA polymerase sigma-70 factor (ECF subfamily)
MRYFSRRHEGDGVAGDLVQETFAQFARAIQEKPQLKCARGYLFGIARHLSQGAWARKKIEMLPLDEESLASPEPDDRIDAARETIAFLPSLQREILDLRFAQDLSYAEMAEVLGIPVGTVRSRLHNAIAELRLRLESDLLQFPS